ncbi:hypothetical protein ABIA54_000298 [Pseudomonas sp. EB276 TE3739]|uniref:hypothetical protein n=1 Tax=Pseudomonas TaxID=286 RepID=UPI0020A0046E|nr:hypothetical protein [Pseudomonas koreensis]MCP1475608.1 hypothetical protein [Pseudomonas koreensis]
MNITIKNILREHPEGSFVEYSTPYGNGKAVFIGPHPKINSKYDVEINIDDDFFWGRNLTQAQQCAPSIKYHSDQTLMSVELIAIEEDGCGVLRMGDSIMLISIEKEYQKHDLPMFIDLISNKISLHPTNT